MLVKAILIPQEAQCFPLISDICIVMTGNQLGEDNDSRYVNPQWYSGTEPVVKNIIMCRAYRGREEKSNELR